MATNNANDFNNPIAISQGGTSTSSMSTADGVVYYDSSSLVVTDVGMSMQLLTSNGSGIAPTWQAGGGGAPSGQGWDFIESQTATVGVSQLNFTSISNAYNIYKIVLSHGNNPNIWLRYSTNGGLTYVSSGYKAALVERNYVGGFSQVPFPTDSTQAYITRRAGGGFVAGSNNATLFLFNVTNGLTCVLVGEGAVSGNTQFSYASLNNGTAINALRVILNLSGGNNVLSLYGLNES